MNPRVAARREAMMGVPLVVNFAATHPLREQLSAQRQRLLGIAYSWCHDIMLAEDLVHETLARALEKIDRLRDHDRVEVWVTRIMVNLFRDWHRRKRPVVGIHFDVEAEGDDPEQDIERQRVIRRIRHAVSRLGEQQRQVIALVDIAEFSYADAANILDIPIGTVMSRLCRARRSLREILERDDTLPAMSTPAVGRR
ncbi:MAG: RNA polymerase sigma factor [Gammaproteobacteria bacterium]|nr:RNA polymerase sigma factor [Gammaproteobacteria bacterium]